MRIITTFMLVLIAAIVAPAQTNKEFQKLLTENNLTFNMPDGFKETKVKVNSDLSYNYAIKYRKDLFEVRYTIFSLKPLIKQYKESLNNPNESVIDPNKYHNSMFATNILNVSQAGAGNMPEIADFPLDAVKNEFGAGYGATSFFTANSEFAKGYGYCMMLVLHKEDIADVYVSFLGNEQKKFAEYMSMAFNSLRFKNNTGATSRNENKDVIKNQGDPIICLWSSLSLRETPSIKGKWKTLIYLGEKATYLGESAIDSTQKKPTEYVKIKLSDGTVGWTRGSFLAFNAKPYALTQTSKLYKRPDISTPGEYKFDRMQFVVVLEEQGEWAKIKGYEREINWYGEGWIKKEYLTANEIDIAVAALASRAMSKKKDEWKLKALNEILENTDLRSSQFINNIQSLIDELNIPKEKAEEDRGN